MPAKSRSANNAATPGWWYHGARMLLGLLIVVALLGGLIWAGRWSLEHLQGHDRYDVVFADIVCEPPAGMSRHDFLDEVRYESQLPKKLNLLDQNLEQKLKEGFARHRWVEEVSAIVIRPPKQLEVKLKYRKR